MTEWEQTFAARHTVQARAPRTTGALPLETSKNEHRMKGKLKKRTWSRILSPIVDPCDGCVLWSGFQSIATVIKKRARDAGQRATENAEQSTSREQRPTTGKNRKKLRALGRWWWAEARSSRPQPRPQSLN